VTRYAALSTSQSVFYGLPGTQLQSLPAVKVYDSNTHQGIPNVTVRFTSPDGPALDYTTQTRPDGIAQLNSLTLNPSPLKSSIVATVAGVGSISFTTIAVSSTITQKYVIVSQGEADVSRDSVRQVYELFDDGTYASGVDHNGSITLNPSRLRYVTLNGTLNFCFDSQAYHNLPLFDSCGYLYASGAITRDTMSVTYAVEPGIFKLDFPEQEIYVRLN
jgi:hypothetical protein